MNRYHVYWTESSDNLLDFDEEILPLKRRGLIQHVPGAERNQGAVYDVAPSIESRFQDLAQEAGLTWECAARTQEETK